MSSKPLALFALALLLITLPSAADTIRVPADQLTIQAGIDAAVDGDTVLVANGVYVGPGNRDITLDGKAITVQSEHGFTACIIDCQALGRGFLFTNGEGPDSVLQGFTIRNGLSDDGGGGINCDGTSPVIEENRIENCVAEDEGGGIFCRNGSPFIRHNLITGCEAGFQGGGICCLDCSATIESNSISDNSSPAFGGGIHCEGGSLTVIDNSITHNSSDHGGGMDCWADGVVTGNSFISNFGDLMASAIYCASGIEARITGNTISENECDMFGGSIAIGFDATAIIADNIFTDNFGGDYGAIWFFEEGYGSYGTVSGNVMTGNGERGSCVSFGIAITALDRSPAPECTLPCPTGPPGGRGGEKLVINNFFVGNNGSAIFHEHQEALVVNCTIVGNTTGVVKRTHGQLTITNSIIRGNTNEQINGSPNVLYSNIEGGYGGPTNIDEDALFIRGPLGDYYLSHTEAGQPADSPCIDSGSAAAETICFQTVDGTICLDELTTRTDSIADTGQVDMGFHYRPSSHIFGLAVAPGPSPANPPLIRIFPPHTDAEHVAEFSAYGATSWGANVTAGSLTDDQGQAIITGAGPGAIYGPHVRGFTSDGTPIPGVSFLAYGTNKFGVNVAAGDLDGDGYDEIVTGAGPGAVFGPHVRGWNVDGGDATALPDVSFFAYGTHKWGVNVACGDIDADGFDEIITGAGPGAVFGPHVRGWDVDGELAEPLSWVNFLAYGTNRFGVNVATGDVDGDGIDEIITVPGPSSLFGSHVRGWNVDGGEATAMPAINFFAWPPGEASYGARVYSGVDLDGNGRDELLVGGGPDPGIGSPINAYHSSDHGVTLDFTLDAFPPVYTHGVNVAAGRF